MIEACKMIEDWNKNINSVDDFVTSYAGMKDLSANCMAIEAIGEGVKKIDKLIPEFFSSRFPDYNWKGLKGMRDKIAHGYFEIDADFVLDVVKNEINPLRAILERAGLELRSMIADNSGE